MSGKTNNEPLYQRYNVDGVFNRSVIAGLLNLLNHKVTYTQVWEDKVSEEVTVPFAYNFAYAKDQRFAQDNYTFFGRECFSDKLIDGKFDMLPRFAVTYTGSQIDSSNITNRFVKGQYQKIDGGEIKSYVAYLYSVPLTLNFDLEGWIDNYDTAFKIEQKIIEIFYKNQTFRVLYKGMNVQCRAGFPETSTIGDKTVSYSFEQENQLKMNFSISVECYLPCFDDSTAIDASKKIENIAFDVTHYDAVDTPDNKFVKFELLNPEPGEVYSTGSELEIRWNYKSNTSEVCTVLLYYKTDDGEKHIIDLVSNRSSYNWTIPSSLSKIDQPDIIFIEDGIEVIIQPVVEVKPDADGVVRGKDCFRIIEKGKFSRDGYVQVSMESLSRGSKIKVCDGYIAKIVNGELDSIYRYTDDEVSEVSGEFQYMNKKPLNYNVKTKTSKISVGISYPLDMSFFDEKSNILII